MALAKLVEGKKLEVFRPEAEHTGVQAGVGGKCIGGVECSHAEIMGAMARGHGVSSLQAVFLTCYVCFPAGRHLPAIQRCRGAVIQRDQCE